MIGSELVRPGAKTPWTRVSTRPRPDLQHLSEHLGGFGGVYPSTHPLALSYPGDRMLIADPEHQWIHPQIPQSWACAHEKTRDRGHTTLYVIHALTSDEVLYVGITVDVRRRFKEHRRSKPWWHNSENASLECYTSWDDAAEAERSRIETWQPLYNIAGNASRVGNCTTCRVCGYDDDPWAIETRARYGTRTGR